MLSLPHPAEVLKQVRAEYSSNFHLDWLDPLGFDNSFAMTVRGEDSRSRQNLLRF